jgi:hypothetical protein
MTGAHHPAGREGAQREENARARALLGDLPRRLIPTAHARRRKTMTTKPIQTTLALLALLGAMTAGCDDKKSEAPASGATAAAQGATTAAAPAGGGKKCEQAAVHLAKLHHPDKDPKTLGSVEFDKMDCEGGKWSATKADCILAARDYDTASKCP